MVKDNSGFRRDNQSQNNGGSLEMITKRPQNNGGQRGRINHPEILETIKIRAAKNNGFKTMLQKRNEEMNRVSNESKIMEVSEVEIAVVLLVNLMVVKEAMAEKEAMVEDLDNRRYSKKAD